MGAKQWSVNVRGQLYLAGMIGASISHIFEVVAFTGEFDLIRWGVFMVLFLAVFVGFEKFIAWTEPPESEKRANSRTDSGG